MSYHVTATDPSLLPDAFALFRRTYVVARRAHPLLPALTTEYEARLQRRLGGALGQRGVAVTRDGRLRGYMIASARFDTHGLAAAVVPEFAHAAAAAEFEPVYGRLYAALAERLVGEGIHLHMIGHFASATRLTRLLYELGFGALVAEQLRDLSDVAAPAGAVVQREERWDAVADLAAEHEAYYRASPMFLLKGGTPATIAADLDEHKRAGDALFVHRSEGVPQAYLIVGRCPGATMGRLFEGTDTAQVRSAYTTPAARGRGIGTALLRGAVGWARAGDFERVLVEHETANPLAAPFWRRHFNHYLTYSMRYVDRRL